MNFDLISTPLHITNPIYKQNDTYAFRLTDELDAKLVIAHKKIVKKTYFYIRIEETNNNEQEKCKEKHKLRNEIENNKNSIVHFNEDTNEIKKIEDTTASNFNNTYSCQIIKSTSEIYEFNLPIDFLLPNDAQFYYNMYNDIVLQDVELCMQEKEYTDGPFYCVPTLSLIEPFKSLPTKYDKVNVAEKSHVIFHDWNNDDVPTGCNSLFFNKMKKKKEFDTVCSYMRAVVDDIKIFDKFNEKLKFERYLMYENDNDKIIQKNINSKDLLKNINEYCEFDNNTEKECNDMYNNTEKEFNDLYNTIDTIIYEKNNYMITKNEIKNCQENKLDEMIDFSNEVADSCKNKFVNSEFYNNRTTHSSNQINEICNLNKKCIELVNSRGRYGKYKLSKTAYLSFLPLFAYYSINGPWARCWIKYGYDPRTDYKNYYYQRLTKFKINNGVNFLYQDLELLQIVKKNENKYISKVYSYDKGFFKNEFILYMKRYYKMKGLNKMIEDEEIESSCFEIL